MRRILTSVVALALTACSAARDEDSDTITITDDIACAACTIRLEPVLTIGTDDGAGALVRKPSVVLTDTRGRYMLPGAPLPQLFDSAGVFVGAIARVGDGPGEMKGSTWPIPVGGDSILVFHGASPKFSLFDPQLKYVRDIPRPPVNQSRVLRWPDSVVFVADAGKGRQLQIIDFSDREPTVLTRSSTSEISDPAGIPPWSNERRFFVIASGGGDHIWLAETHAYELSEWNRDLTVAARARRHAAWWPKSYVPLSPANPPSPRVAAVHVDRTGLLWVFITVAGTHWKDAWTGTAAGTELRESDVDFEKLYDTVIEVIDPKTRRLVATRRIDDEVINAISDHRLAIYTPTPDGNPRVTVMAISLTGLAGRAEWVR